MPAVKANAYGHGAIEICRELNRLGIRSFCVATALEGVALRKHHMKGEILILGYTPPEQFCLLRRYRLMQTVIDLEYAKCLDNYGKKITVHVAVDTGLRRLGESLENIDRILQIFEHKNLVIAGIYSHFSGASEDFTQTQADRFGAVLSIGYADGIPRSLSCGVGNVLIGGVLSPIVGCVCMDQTIVDVTKIENIKQGDIAVIIGKDGEAEISALDIAEQAKTVPNEVLSRLGGRLTRG
jgi:alanine racemase